MLTCRGRSELGTASRSALGQLLSLLKSYGFTSGAFAFVIATGAVSASNFLFHAVISRLIGPANYGVLGSILNVLLVLSVPLGALQVAVTQATVRWERFDRVSDGLQRLVWKVMLAGLIGTLLIIVSADWAAVYLHLDTQGALYALSAWLIPALLVAVLQGVLIGQSRFGAVAIANLVGGGVARLAFGIALVLLGFGVAGAVAASAFSQLVTVLILARPLVPYLRRATRGSGTATGAIGVGTGFRTMIAMSGYWVIVSMDTTMARHYLSSTSAGWYASAATLGRIALFLPGAISLLALPRFVSGEGRSKEARDALRWSLSATFAISMAAGIVLAVSPQIFVQLLFGSSFAGAAPVVRVLGLEAAVLGVIGLLVYYLLALRSRISYFTWVGAFLAAGLIVEFHRNATSIAIVMAVTVTFVAVAMLIGLIWSLKQGDVLAVDTSVAGEYRDLKASWESTEIDVTLVVPFYNPGPALRRHVAEVVTLLSESGHAFEVIAVSDGSTDGSLDDIVSLASEARGVFVLDLKQNCGKGYALQMGLSNARGRYIGYMDGDGDIPASDLMVALSAIEVSSADVIIGSKKHPESVVEVGLHRRVCSWTYQSLVKVLFSLSVSDTQTGLKIIRKGALREVLPVVSERGFAFDLEMLVVARQFGFSRVVEVPVTIQRREVSTITWLSVFRTIAGTARIFVRLRILHKYRGVLPEDELVVAGGESCEY